MNNKEKIYNGIVGEIDEELSRDENLSYMKFGMYDITNSRYISMTVVI